jgi:ATP-dependent 26S proteasome regulatory subunit
MDYSDPRSADIVHLARLALAGRPQDVHMHMRRLATKSRSTDPRLAEALTDLLKQCPTRQSPLRDAGLAVVPVDQDSRLQLIRCELAPRLDRDPIWAQGVRSAVEQIVSERRMEPELAAAGLAPSRAVLLTGPPGVGKTMAARWVAAQLQQPLLVLDLSAVMSSFLGRTGVNLRHVLDYAKGTRGVLLLDELDAIAKRRDDATEIGELKRLVTVLLQEIDDWPVSSLLIAATNHAELLDPAVWRRFDAHVTFPLPDLGLRQMAVDAFIGADVSGGHELLEALAVVMDGLSFSDMERQIMQCRRKAVIDGSDLTDTLEDLVRSHTVSAPRAERMAIARHMLGAGFSQRRVHTLTGVSRDTLRKRGIAPLD